MRYYIFFLYIFFGLPHYGGKLLSIWLFYEASCHAIFNIKNLLLIVYFFEYVLGLLPSLFWVFALLIRKLGQHIDLVFCSAGLKIRKSTRKGLRW